MDMLLKRVKQCLNSYDTSLFSHLVVTPTSFSVDSRHTLHDLCNCAGIQYCPKLVRGYTTHLLVAVEEYTGNDPAHCSFQTPKFHAAIEWNVPIVSLQWLIDSIKDGKPQDEDQYLLLGGRVIPETPRARGHEEDKENVVIVAAPYDDDDRGMEAAYNGLSRMMLTACSIADGAGDGHRNRSSSNTSRQASHNPEPTRHAMTSIRHRNTNFVTTSQCAGIHSGKQTSENDEVFCRRIIGNHTSPGGSVSFCNDVNTTADENCPSIGTWVPASQPRTPTDPLVYRTDTETPVPTSPDDASHQIYTNKVNQEEEEEEEEGEFSFGYLNSGGGEYSTPLERKELTSTPQRDGVDVDEEESTPDDLIQYQNYPTVGRGGGHDATVTKKVLTASPGIASTPENLIPGSDGENEEEDEETPTDLVPPHRPSQQYDAGEDDGDWVSRQPPPPLPKINILEFNDTYGGDGADWGGGGSLEMPLSLSSSYPSFPTANDEDNTDEEEEEGEEPTPSSSTSSNRIFEEQTLPDSPEINQIIARARAPTPPVPPLPPVHASLDDCIPTKLLPRAPRGSSVKVAYRLSTTDKKFVKFAEQVYLRGKRFTLTARDKQTAVVLDDGGIVDPISFYRLLGEDWHMECHRLYTLRAAQDVGGEDVRLRLPTAYDAEAELLRGTSRCHIDVRRVKGTVGVRRVHVKAKPLRVKSEGEVCLYWRCEFDDAAAAAAAGSKKSAQVVLPIDNIHTARELAM